MNLTHILLSFVLFIGICTLIFLVIAFYSLKNKKSRENRLFEIGLVLFVFLLTIISSIASGIAVYGLTSNERPLLTFTVSDYNRTNGLLTVKINNFRDTPANNIYVYYQINNSNNLSQKKELFHLDELYKGIFTKQIKFSKFRGDIIWDLEDYLDEHYDSLLNNSSIEIYYDKKETYFDTKRNKTVTRYVENDNPLISEEYLVIFSVNCDNCKSEEIIINPYELTFDFNLNCTKNKYFDCNMTKEHVYLG